MFIRYAQLRARLLPYIYSCALEAHETGMPIIRPLPLMFGGFAEVSRQYMFGPHLMVGCYTEELQLPEGRWMDAWSGEWMEGGRTVPYVRPENWGGALLIREGAVIPQEDGQEGTILHLFPLQQGSSCFVLYEDDGESAEYLEGAISKTVIHMTSDTGSVAVSISAPEGSWRGMHAGRLWRLILHDQRRLVVQLANDADCWQAEESICCL